MQTYIVFQMIIVPMIVSHERDCCVKQFLKSYLTGDLHVLEVLTCCLDNELKKI